MYRMLWLLPMLASLLTGCATLQPGDDEVAGLHERIRSGEAVAVGEQVRVTTRDGGERTLTVTAVDGDVLYGLEAIDDLPPEAAVDPGEEIGIAIGDIVHVEHVGAGPGPTADDFRNALFLFAIGVMAVIAAFANF
jgi:hypothetical protein